MAGLLTEAGLELLGKRLPLINKKQRIAIIDESVENEGKEREKMLELMRQHNIEGNTDQRRFEALQGNFDFHQKRVREMLDERAVLQRELAIAHMVFLEECLGKTSEISEALLPVVMAVRKELELPLNEEAYRGTMRALKERQQADIAKLLTGLRALVEDEYQRTSQKE